jgi:hypothetical protein
VVPHRRRPRRRRSTYVSRHRANANKRRRFCPNRPNLKRALPKYCCKWPRVVNSFGAFRLSLKTRTSWRRASQNNHRCRPMTITLTRSPAAVTPPPIPTACSTTTKKVPWMHACVTSSKVRNNIRKHQNKEEEEATTGKQPKEKERGVFVCFCYWGNRSNSNNNKTATQSKQTNKQTNL